MNLLGAQRWLYPPACDWALSLLVEGTSTKQSTHVCQVLQARLTKGSLLSPSSRTICLTIATEPLSASMGLMAQPWLLREQLRVPRGRKERTAESGLAVSLECCVSGNYWKAS